MSEATALQVLPPQAPAAPREFRVVTDSSPMAYLLDTARYEHTQRIASGMARASLIPKHLKGNSPEQALANCFLVVNQSLRWGFDPFAVAPETYEIGGKLAYQGKLVAAVINARAGLVGRLNYDFNEKTGDDLAITVSGTFSGEEKPRTVTVSVKEARTSNDMWTKNPRQKLVYNGSTMWARRHAPEIILGVLTDDDIERIRDERPQDLAATKTTFAEVLGGKPTPEQKADPTDDLDMSQAIPAPATEETLLDQILRKAAGYGVDEIDSQPEVLVKATARWGAQFKVRRYANLSEENKATLLAGWDALMEGGK